MVQRDSGKRNSNRLFVIVGPNEARSEVGGAIEAKVTEKGNANIGDAFRLLHLATLQYLAFGEDTPPMSCAFYCRSQVHAAPLTVAVLLHR